MSSLKNVGKAPSQNLDVANKSYVESLTAQNLSQASVDSLVSSGLSSYCLKSYVDNKDALNATLSYIQSGDSARLAKARVNANSGVPGLDSTGKIPIERIDVSSTQRWPKGFWSPSSYLASPLYVAGETALFSCPVSDPGFVYKIIATGLLNVGLNISNSIQDIFGEYPLIYVRQGSQAGPIIAQGYGCSEHYQWGMDLFERSSNADLGPQWAQVYSGPGAGSMVTDGHQAVWNDSGTKDRSCRARRINPLDMTTIGDTQYVSWWVGDNDIGGNTGLDDPASNSLLGRMSSDGSTYIRLRINFHQASLWYAVGGNDIQFPGTYDVSQGTGDAFTLVCGYNNNPRQFAILKNGGVVGTWTDGNGVSALGANYRGWGIGMEATQATAILPIGQHTPADMSMVWIQDPLNPSMADNNNQGPVNIIPTPLSAQSPITGATTLYVSGMRSGGSITTGKVSTLNPRLQVWAVPA